MSLRSSAKQSRSVRGGEARELSRRQFLRSIGIAAAGVSVGGGLLISCSSDEPGGGGAPEPETPTPELDSDPSPVPEDELVGEFSEAVYGGSLRIALIDEPPTFDIHQTTAANTAFVGWHIFEALFTWDAELRPIPELPEEYEISDDGLTHSFRLRPEVLFHDGQPLTAHDVVASIERWGSRVGLGESLLEAIDEFHIIDDLTFEIRLVEPFGTMPVALARQNQGCAIYPVWAIEEAGDGPLQSIIGTGPYRFVEHLPDRHILLERFEVYTPAPGEADGYGGHKHRFLDELYFIAVADEPARIAGLQTGDYHFLESISPDQISAIEEDPNIVSELTDACCYPNLVINQSSRLMGNQHLRRAAQIALDHEPIMQAGYGDGYFRLDPSLLMRETPWYTTTGDQYYDVQEPDRARRLLEEAEYDGTALRFMVTQAYRDLYNASLVIAQQLEEAGFVVALEIYDWATLVERRDREDIWDLYLTLATFRPDPIMRNLTCEAPGWWCDPEKDELLKLLQRESDFETRYQLWEGVQRLYYEQVPRIKIGDTYSVVARSPRIEGFPTLTQLQPSFWNSWLRDD
jgi:peptide/nickel transport system substrate-binding protein